MLNIISAKPQWGVIFCVILLMAASIFYSNKVLAQVVASDVAVAWPEPSTFNSLTSPPPLCNAHPSAHNGRNGLDWLSCESVFQLRPRWTERIRDHGGCLDPDAEAGLATLPKSATRGASGCTSDTSNLRNPVESNLNVLWDPSTQQLKMGSELNSNRAFARVCHVEFTIPGTYPSGNYVLFGYSECSVEEYNLINCAVDIGGQQFFNCDFYGLPSVTGISEVTDSNGITGDKWDVSSVQTTLPYTVDSAITAHMPAQQLKNIATGLCLTYTVYDNDQAARANRVIGMSLAECVDDTAEIPTSSGRVANSFYMLPRLAGQCQYSCLDGYVKNPNYIGAGGFATKSYSEIASCPANATDYTYQVNDLCIVANNDSDLDTILNSSDNCPNTPNQDQLDTDSDNLGDACDTDDDNDGILDGSDAFPLDATESVDTDHDGMGNTADEDDDGDGMPDDYELANGLDPLLNDANDVNPDGITHYQAYLNSIAGHGFTVLPLKNGNVIIFPN